MLSRIFGALSAIGGILSWFWRKTIEALFFDHVARMTDPLLSSVVEYGPPTILALLALWLLGAHKFVATKFLPARVAAVSPAAPSRLLKKSFATGLQDRVIAVVER